jgi:LPXTG-motif cell wall-anchored protein
MRYSKILLAIVLISMLVFGSTMSAFAVKSYEVTVSVGEGMGSVTGGGEYVYDAEVTVTATPDPGYEFDKWIMTCGGGTMEHFNASFMFNMHPHDVTLVACFKEVEDELRYNLMVSAFDPSMGEVSGSGNYAYTQDVHVKATPKTGYQFDKWMVNFNDGNGFINPGFSQEFTCNLSHCGRGYFPNVELVAHFKPMPSVLLHYINTASEFLSPEEILYGPLGTSYVTVAKTFTGYELTAMPSNATGVFDEVQGHVDYIYREVTTEPTTAPTTEATTEPTTAPTTEATTEPTTAPTTEASTEPTTSATTAAADDDDDIITITFIPTTSPATEATEVVTEEGVPLGAAGVVNFDDIYQDDDVNFDEFVEDETLAGTDVVVEDGEEILDDEVPLADGLPQTGQVSADMFYGIGGLISGLGLWLKRKK